MRWLLSLIAATAIYSQGAFSQTCRAEITPIGPPMNACIGAERLRIAAVGDVLLHRPLQRRGYASESGFKDIWRAIEPIFDAAHISYANLEGPVAPGIAKGGRETADPGPVFDDRVYSSFPMFNYHPRVIAGLQASGIDVVSTANNHALDRGPRGVDRTIDNLEAAGLPFTGTIRQDAPRQFVTHVQSPLGWIAFIACSYSTNGLDDPKSQTLLCFEDRDELLALTAAAVNQPGTSAVIVTPHWGAEYSHSPNRRQRALARELIASGATAVIGTHPHVVQPWEIAPNGRANGLIIYSTGNFVSGQGRLERRTGALAWLELCKAPPARDLGRAIGSKLQISHAGWLPVIMNRTAEGPEVLPVLGDVKGLAAEARRLLERHLPENAISFRIRCRASDADSLELQ